MSHVNGSVDHVERPLMTPDEVMRLRPPQKAGNGTSEQIIAPGDMLIFVSGHFPILGMQMLYFFDPELSRRASLPPPAQLQGLDSGFVISQKPVGRTRNVISRPEVAETDEAASQLEKGFLEELQGSNPAQKQG
jgi:type IV secretory pathway TraG/TraD family ATPase VirD4